MDPKQLRRPVIESSGAKCPAARVRQPLPLRKVELGLLAVINVEVDADPADDGSIRRAERLDATQKPAISSFIAACPKGHLPSRSSTETVRPNLARFVVIVR